VLEPDTSSDVSTGVLSIYDAKGVLHPMVFISKNYTPVEENYIIHRQELGTILKSLE
jgi:hypothetical protein